jgi:PEP-CTERM motif-containing protein
VTGADSFNTTGGKGSGSELYDINVQFAEGDTTNEFQYGDSITYLITDPTNTITAPDFNTFSSGSDGSTTQYVSAAYIENGDNGWVVATDVPTPTPEPSTLVMTGSALALIGSRLRRWRRSV